MDGIFIFGIDGSIGSRYRAILRDHLFIDVFGFDIATGGILPKLNKFDGFIIATPTDTHLDMIEKLLPYKKPILVEKPISKDMRKLEDFENKHRHELDLVTVVNQYRYLYDPESTGDSSYSYFRSGPDGIAWDCVSINTLSERPPLLSNRSAVWQCTINGTKIPLEQMDLAYIAMIKDWVLNPKSNYMQAREGHLKTARWISEGRI